MPDPMQIKSHKGTYQVRFAAALPDDWTGFAGAEAHWLVDANVARLYAAQLATVLADPRCLVIEATEENKSIERIIGVMRTLVANRLRRNHVLVAIGGGIIQDITCFIASTMLRGVPWRFVPTTLLAQADSCIGSKSSVNLGDTKNILGTFNPPREILICTRFIDTLAEHDVRSGVGEIIKVHAIEGATAFDQLAADYAGMLGDRRVLEHYIGRALSIKQRFIEVDEFDAGIRNVFNYGHSFGHAIEAATEFAVPHGIAVTMGMAIANSVAAQRGLIESQHQVRMRPVLARNYQGYGSTHIPRERFFDALSKDKKNTSSQLVLVLPVGPGASIERVAVDNDPAFRGQCERAFGELAA